MNTNLTPQARQRLAAILTPAFSALSAALTGWLAKHFPGLPAIPASDLTALEITGALAGAGAALKWLHGQQKLVTLTDEARGAITAEIARTHAGPSLKDIEKLTVDNRAQIVAAIESAVHAPPSVDQVVSQILAQATSAPAPVAPAPPAA